MGAATYKVTIRTDQANEEGKNAVRIRITKDRTTKYYHTAIFLKLDDDPRKSEWNLKATMEKQNWVTSRNRDFVAHNAHIKRVYDGLKEIESIHPTYTAAQIRDAYNKPVQEEKKLGLVPYFLEWVRRKRESRKYGTARSYISIFGYLTEYTGNDVPENILTPSLGSSLVSSMLAQKYAPNTINDALGKLRTLFRHAVLEGYLPPMRNPFEVGKVEKEDTPVDYLTEEQLLSLIDLQIPINKKHLYNARNIFLMQYFLHGARFSEAVLLRWNDVQETQISYRPKKRSSAKKTIPRHAGIDWVLNQYPQEGKYVFPYMEGKDLTEEATEKRITICNRRVNLHLRTLAKIAGLEVHLHTHIQRHTFADRVWNLTGDLRVVQEMVGHGSAKTTENYLQQLGVEIKNQVSEQLYSGVLSGNAQENKLQKPAQSRVTETASKEK